MRGLWRVCRDSFVEKGSNERHARSAYVQITPMVQLYPAAAVRSVLTSGYGL